MPTGPLHRRHREAEARRGAEAGRHRARRRAACSAATAASSASRSASAAASVSRAGAALRRAARCGGQEVVVGPRESLHAHWLIPRNVNWLGDGPFEAAAAKGMSVPCSRAIDLGAAAGGAARDGVERRARAVARGRRRGGCGTGLRLLCRPDRPKRGCWAEDGSRTRRPRAERAERRRASVDRRTPTLERSADRGDHL